MAWEDAIRKRQEQKQSEQPLKCNICQILIGEGHIERVAYQSPNGIICSQCANDDPIRIDTADRGWQERLNQCLGR